MRQNKINKNQDLKYQLRGKEEVKIKMSMKRIKK